MKPHAAALPELNGEDRALFASDVHLDERDAATERMFLDALAREGEAASHVFLLGDLFEAWIGDDDPGALGQRVAQRLAALARAGTRLYLMRGNRDFLLDAPLPVQRDVDLPRSTAATGNAGAPGRASRTARAFSARCGATMLADPCSIVLFGTPTLLAHGDALCTDDAAYQAFRAQVRSPHWQREFLSHPLSQRVATARALRERSESEKAGKAEYLMDVNPDAVENTMRAAAARLLIHGHTHRPARHLLAIDGEQAQRWVLPDWDAGARRGGMLLATNAGLRQLGAWA